MNDGSGWMVWNSIQILSSSFEVKREEGKKEKQSDRKEEKGEMDVSSSCGKHFHIIISYSVHSLRVERGFCRHMQTEENWVTTCLTPYHDTWVCSKKREELSCKKKWYTLCGSGNAIRGVMVQARVEQWIKYSQYSRSQVTWWPDQWPDELQYRLLSPEDPWTCFNWYPIMHRYSITPSHIDCMSIGTEWRGCSTDPHECFPVTRGVQEDTESISRNPNVCSSFPGIDRAFDSFWLSIESLHESWARSRKRIERSQRVASSTTWATF